MSRLSILIVEDESIIAMMVEDMLISLGHKVTAVAGSLQKGLQLIENETFDIALLDMNLNGTSSLPIASRLRVKKIPFVFTTGYGAGIEEEWRDQPYLQKPFTEEDLDRALQQLAPLSGHA